MKLLRLACVVAVLGTACDSATLPGAGGAPVLRGEVHYQGSRVAPLRVAVFNSFPPRSAPVAFQEISAPKFPQAFEVRGIPAGRYFVLALLDVDPTDGDAFRPSIDSGGAFGGFASPAPVTLDVATGASGIRIELADPSPDSPWSRLNYR